LVQSKSFIEKNWVFFQENEYVLTPIFGRKITNKHLKNGNPSKLFNYILQATETEIALTALNRINDYLRNKLTKPILYTYDSILFDFYKNDGFDVLKEIYSIMMLNNRFPVKIYSGDNYNNMIQIYP